MARGLKTATAQKKARAAISARASDLAKHCSGKFSFNKTHVLVEMVSAVPHGVEVATVDSKSESPLVTVNDDSFWQFVTMGNPDVIDGPEGGDFARAALDVVDMQVKHAPSLLHNAFPSSLSLPLLFSLRR